MNMNTHLFISTPEMKEQDVPKEVATMVGRFSNGELLSPLFQRDYIWKREKLIGWAKSIISGKAIGVIVTYQLKGGGPVFLADGLQRLTATKRFMENPQAYGFEFGPAQARRWCEVFAVTVQHRIYETHSEARQAFQNLNKGTSLTPAEFYKGQLCLNEEGEESLCGGLMQEQLPKLVKNIVDPLTSGRAIPRQQMSTFTRDSYAMFYQYTSGYEGKIFWNIGRQKMEDAKPIESMLRQFVQGWSSEKLESKLSSFQVFLRDQIAVIETISRETGQAEKCFSRTLLRWLLHLSIWRKNNRVPVNQLETFLRQFFSYYKDYKTFGSRIELTSDNGEKELVTLQTGALTRLPLICETIGVKMEASGGRRKSDKVARLGYNVSHVLPLAEFGEGETIIEPALRNKARGAKPIESVA